MYRRLRTFGPRVLGCGSLHQRHHIIFGWHWQCDSDSGARKYRSALWRFLRAQAHNQPGRYFVSPRPSFPGSGPGEWRRDGVCFVLISEAVLALDNTRPNYSTRALLNVFLIRVPLTAPLTSSSHIHYVSCSIGTGIELLVQFPLISTTSFRDLFDCGTGAMLPRAASMR
jgi:hypothetical protein